MPSPNMTLAGSSQALDTSLPTIFSEFLLLRDETGVMRDVSTRYDLQPHTGASKNVINYGRVVAYNVADGVDIAQAQTLSDTLTAFTPTEVAVQVILAGSTMRRVADPDLQGRTAKILNNAYNLKEDADGTGQFASFTGTTIGGTTTVCSPGHIAAAAGQLRVGLSSANPEPAPDPLFAVIHPLSAVPLAGRLIPYATTPGGGTAYGGTPSGGSVALAGVSVAAGTSEAQFQQQLLSKGIGGLGMLAGLDIRQDANIAVTSTPSATGGAFSKEGMIYVSELEPRLDPDTSDKSLRGAVELNLWGSYVWGVYRAGAYGVPIQFDASLPTS